MVGTFSTNRSHRKTALLMTTSAPRPPTRLRLARTALAAGALAIIPMATTAMAQVESSTTAQMQRFADVLRRVKALYVEPVTDEQLIDGAIQGMLTSLDPHSAYLDQFDNENLRTQTDGQYGGLGLTVSLEDGAVKVIAPFEDSPADKAGVKAGDYITHLDDKLIVGGTLDEAVEQMRGEPGSKITLTVVRAGVDDPLVIPVTRQIVELKAVKWEVKDGVGIINLNGFSRDAADEVAKAIQGIRAQTGGKPLGYVLDMRSNPGGLLNQAIDVSDLFLTKGEVVSQRGRMRGENATYYARPGDMTNGAPMIVLIDVGSASASEIVAGALQDHHRAVIMGERSFGKGSVQTVFDLTPTTALRLTTARYFTPSGRSVQEGGIKPDIPVPQLTDPNWKKRPRIREADLRRHLVNEQLKDESVIEDDLKDDPRFKMTADELKAKGVEDFQLNYAIETLARQQRVATKTGAR